jgi:hypothetical protein
VSDKTAKRNETKETVFLFQSKKREKEVVEA